MTDREPHELIDHLFRHEAGRMTASLVRIFGLARLELVEDVVQDALVKALHHWSFHGVPERPRSWLVTVARRGAIDALRRESIQRARIDEMRHWARAASAAEASSAEAASAEWARDDQLALIVALCDERFPIETRLALTLKTVSGMGVAEIARGLLAQESAIAQRITRAKRRLAEDGIALPDAGEPLPAERLDDVLAVIYLVFAEGHLAHRGADLMRPELLEEAGRLMELVLAADDTATPSAWALAALMDLHAARVSARLGPDGELVPLPEQDRSRWDRRRLDRGIERLQRSAQGETLSRYHLEAGIAGCHAAAASAADTPWAEILKLYDMLLERHPSPLVALNRAVAVAEVHGPEAALSILHELDRDERLSRHALLPAVRGELLRRAGRRRAAATAFRAALALDGGTDPERRLVEARLRACADGSG